MEDSITQTQQSNLVQNKTFLLTNMKSIVHCYTYLHIYLVTNNNLFTEITINYVSLCVGCEFYCE